jgi:hypothetical protein
VRDIPQRRRTFFFAFADNFILRAHNQCLSYSKIRVAVPKGNTLKGLFPQEKATFEALIKGTFTMVLL